MSELQFKVSVDRYESIPLLRINPPEILSSMKEFISFNQMFFDLEIIQIDRVVYTGQKEASGGIRPQFITHMVLSRNNFQNLQ